jgi:hypothetical protein
MIPATLVQTSPAPAQPSLSQQINDAHKACIAASTAALAHAFRCGELLVLAKENAKAAKRSWLGWLKENCPDIHQTTASAYMRIAEHRDAIEATIETEAEENKHTALSVRGALKQIPTKGTRGAKTGQGVVATKKNVTIEAALKPMEPDEVFTALKARYDPDQLKALTTLLVRHLKGEAA